MRRSRDRLVRARRRSRTKRAEPPLPPRALSPPTARARARKRCAANFICEHLHADYAGGWLHVDMAGPSTADERATGYGVALTLALLGVEGFA